MNFMNYLRPHIDKNIVYQYYTAPSKDAEKIYRHEHFVNAKEIAHFLSITHIKTSTSPASTHVSYYLKMMCKEKNLSYYYFYLDKHNYFMAVYPASYLIPFLEFFKELIYKHGRLYFLDKNKTDSCLTLNSEDENRYMRLKNSRFFENLCLPSQKIDHGILLSCKSEDINKDLIFWEK